MRGITVFAAPRRPDRFRKADIRLDDEARFLKSWLVNPLKTGAVSPSGKDLARAMAEPLDLDIPGDIVELGPGTGPVTEALLNRGVAPERLSVIEFNPDFCTLLRKRFPGIRVIEGDAYAMGRTLAGHISGPLAAVVSSLPLITRPDVERVRLLRDALGMMHPDAPFVQFTYGPASPVPLKGLPVRAEPSKRIWMNLPPARVWTYRSA